MNDPLFKSARRLLLKGGVASVFAAAAPAGAQALSKDAQRDEEQPRAEKSPQSETGISPLMRKVSTYIAQAGDMPLPDAITEATKHHLLDTLAAMISGSRLLPGKVTIAYVKTLGGTPEACVPATRIVTTAVNAAFASGMFAHADETDDSHAPSLTHPGCGVVPAALAMAERERAGGTALLRAIALGYDICTRSALSLGSYDFFASGHDPHGFGPTFGAAAAAASLARLNVDQVRHLLSYTAQSASGVSYQQRDIQHIEKSYDHGGKAARDAVAAATMVAAGFTGVDDAFSGDKNFYFAFRTYARPEELVRGLGESYEVANTNIKRWTVGSPAQAALDSLAELIKTQKVVAANVEKAVIRISRDGALVVNNRSLPDICMQHLAAIMLIDGTVTFASAHDEERMRDPKVLEIRRRVELYGDDELQRALPSRHGIVELTMRDGRELRHHTTAVRGTAQNPMTREEIGEKCFGLCAPVLGKKHTRDLIDTVWHIERLDNVRGLRPLLRA